MTDVRSPGGGYRWVVLGTAMVVVGLAMGTLLSFGIFLAPIQESTGWSRTGISAIALTTWVALGIGSFAWGALSDRWGARPVVVAAGLLLGTGMVLSSRADSLWQLGLAFGGVAGLAVGGFYAPLTSMATRWFVANRGLAVSLVSAGSGLGAFAIAPLARWLISAWDWRVALLVLGDLMWLVIVPLGLLLRPAPSASGGGAAGPGFRGHDDVDVPVREIWRAPQFWVIALTHFLCCAAHSGPIFHMAANATDHGVAAMTAATILGVSGLVSIAGRIGAGVLADRFGAKPTLVAMLGLQAPAILLYLVAGGTGGFYGLAVVFGLAYGGVMPLYALLTREYFGGKAMGTAYGAVFMLQAIGMGLGSFAGGWIHDRLGAYAWLFGTATAVAVAALVFALVLRRPRPVALPLPAAAG
jgi:MFS family permease